LDPYEDPRLPLAERVQDLISRMTVEEKVGLMFQPALEAGGDGSLVGSGGFLGDPPTSELVVDRICGTPTCCSCHPNRRSSPGWTNRLQKMAESSRLGIPS
jgi:beta-glucosidase